MNKTELNTKIAIFGGSFDPIHFGHILPVTSALEAHQVDRLIYLPCYKQPLKQQSDVSSEHRLEMCKMALQSVKTPIQLELSDVEIRAEKTSYTFHTLTEFKQGFPNDELYFVIGMDSLLTFHKWFRWRDILKVCRILVMIRPPFEQPEPDSLDPEINQHIGRNIQFVKNESVTISSSEVRKILASKLTPSEKRRHLSQWLPSNVIKYIEHHKLYID